VPAQGQHIGRGDGQVGRDPHFANGNHHAPQFEVMDLAALEDFGQPAPDQFSDPQLPLGRGSPFV
ncbi:MAG: hypothetical protein ACI86S_001265, partial [Paracoccaceae bacterium]